MNNLEMQFIGDKSLSGNKYNLSYIKDVNERLSLSRRIAAQKGVKYINK